MDVWTQKSIHKKSALKKSMYQIIIPPVESADFENGTYFFKFPQIKEYLNEYRFMVEVVLERSSEIMELNRRLMSSYNSVKNELTSTHGNFKAKCDMFPLKNSCDFSASFGRSWYKVFLKN